MDHLVFDNRFVRDLPGDPDERNVPRQVHGACWSPVMPTPVSQPALVAHAEEVAELLDLSAADVHSPRFAQVFSGNQLLPGMQPYAACYGGHQFGNWAGQLGDGRAISLGEVVNRAGQRWELQLKGAGMTPYSRGADGRAVLRSSIREFLCSEAMYHLGVPTTRALCIVTTGDAVPRDMFYDGRVRNEPGAIVCRVSPSFIRPGHFEIHAARGNDALLETLVDFTIDRDFPWIEGNRTERRAQWFDEVCTRTADLMVHWTRVGFVHGVMNTDNLSILGLTIDYGPYGWIDDYDPDWTPNTTDAGGRRYRFGHQPQVAYWNLGRFAGALSRTLEESALQAGLDHYAQRYMAGYTEMMAAKFGLADYRDEDATLIGDALALLKQAEVDMTLFFRGLADIDPKDPRIGPLDEAFYSDEKRQHHGVEFQAWLARYAARVLADDEPADRRKRRMNAVNPRFVLRNYLAQEAIERAEAGDMAGVTELLDVMRKPYDEQPGREAFARKRPDWARHKAGCSMLSCSS